MTLSSGNQERLFFEADVGGEIEGRIEWILGMNKSYTVIVTDTAAEAQMMSISFDWYEHTPKTE